MVKVPFLAYAISFRAWGTCPEITHVERQPPPRLHDGGGCYVLPGGLRTGPWRVTQNHIAADAHNTEHG